MDGPIGDTDQTHEHDTLPAEAPTPQGGLGRSSHRGPDDPLQTSPTSSMIETLEGTALPTRTAPASCRGPLMKPRRHPKQDQVSRGQVADSRSLPARPDLDIIIQELEQQKAQLTEMLTQKDYSILELRHGSSQQADHIVYLEGRLEEAETSHEACKTELSDCRREMREVRSLQHQAESERDKALSQLSAERKGETKSRKTPAPIGSQSGPPGTPEVGNDSLIGGHNKWGQTAGDSRLSYGISYDLWIMFNDISRYDAVKWTCKGRLLQLISFAMRGITRSDMGLWVRDPSAYAFLKQCLLDISRSLQDSDNLHKSGAASQQSGATSAIEPLWNKYAKLRQKYGELRHYAITLEDHYHGLWESSQRIFECAQQASEVQWSE